MFAHTQGTPMGRPPTRWIAASFMLAFLGLAASPVAADDEVTIHFMGASTFAEADVVCGLELGETPETCQRVDLVPPQGFPSVCGPSICGPGGASIEQSCDVTASAPSGPPGCTCEGTGSARSSIRARLDCTGATRLELDMVGCSRANLRSDCPGSEAEGDVDKFFTISGCALKTTCARIRVNYGAAAKAEGDAVASASLSVVVFDSSGFPVLTRSIAVTPGSSESGCMEFPVTIEGFFTIQFSESDEAEVGEEGSLPPHEGEAIAASDLNATVEFGACETTDARGCVTPEEICDRRDDDEDDDDD